MKRPKVITRIQQARETKAETWISSGRGRCAALTLQLGLFFGTMSSQYRFELPTVVLGIVCAVVGIATWWSGRGPALAADEHPA